MAKNKLRITALGTSILIATDEDETYLERLMAAYRERIKNTQDMGLQDPLQVAVLTGFLLCEEAEKARQAQGGDEAEKLTLSLISLLDAIVPGDAAASPPARPAGTRKAAVEERQTRRAAAPESANAAAGKEPGASAAPAAGSADLPLWGGSEGGSTGGSAGALPLKRGIVKLRNEVKHYDWGDPAWIPDLVGQRNTSRIPWAELWMGTHAGGPSRIAETGPGGRRARTGGVPLAQFIAGDPGYCLGDETAVTWGGLPFLFKVLAARQPLSIQAHPDLALAREGFERENQAGIPLDAPERNYRDDNHKHEILCALRPFTALCGFRALDDLRDLLESFARGAPRSLVPALEPLLGALDDDGGEPAGVPPPLKSFLAALFGMDGVARKELSAYALTQQLDRETPERADEWTLVRWFADLHPGDPAILAPLYLNIVCLEAGQAIYLPAGVLHAYVSGLGVELMASSDNVLRGGLTSKHVDQDELFRALSFSPFKPAVLQPSEHLARSGRYRYRYPVPCAEFSLQTLEGGRNVYPQSGPSIVIVTDGELTITGASNLSPVVLKKGESAFIPAEEARRDLIFQGSRYHVYAAGVGDTGSREDPG